jgi:heterodisulfide reductase subunit C/nitrate reductase gamma subunit
MPMLYTYSFYISLLVFGLGLAYKVCCWLRYKSDVKGLHLPVGKRVVAAAKGIVLTLSGKQVLGMLRVLALDVLLQQRVLQADLLRWVAHFLIFAGFVLLLLMHSLDKVITIHLFRDYQSTLNPFMFLRDLFGVMVMVGLLLVLYRRFVLKVPRLFTKGTDLYAIVILFVILLSGFVLEGTKIVSYTKYQEMVESYAALDNAKESRALESYWVKEFGVVSPHVKKPLDARTLEAGRDLHENNCATCHSNPSWAFAGYVVAGAVKPVALSLDRIGVHRAFWTIHFLACFLALALVPFTKFFHVLTSPLSLLLNAVMDEDRSAAANRVTKEAIEIDACTHCGTCSLRCSVAIILADVPNINILPSEKMYSLKALISGRKLCEQDIRSIQEGIYLCTNCNRCTAVCPVGIDLKNLWLHVREYLIQKGYPEVSVLSPLSFFRGLMKGRLGGYDYERPLELARNAISRKYPFLDRKDETLYPNLQDPLLKEDTNLSLQVDTFKVCFGCESCTTVCPVVGVHDHPHEALGLLPHQIMHSVGLGLPHLTFGSKMLWCCLTCYQCQENCPQGVHVTDVFYALKNMAIQHLKEGAQ